MLHERFFLHHAPFCVPDAVHDNKSGGIDPVNLVVEAADLKTSNHSEKDVIGHICLASFPKSFFARINGETPSHLVTYKLADLLILVGNDGYASELLHTLKDKINGF